MATEARARVPVSWQLAAGAAVALPTLLPLRIPPAGTAMNQVMAVGLWGVVLAVMAPRAAGRAANALLPVWLLLAAGIAASWGLMGLPASPALDALALIGAAALAAWAGASLAESGQAPAAFAAFAQAIVVAAVLNAAVGVVQVYAPQLTDGTVLAFPGAPGIAYGNVRQPNHLSLLLTAGIACAAVLMHERRLPVAAGAPALAFMAIGVALSGSRAGAVELAALAGWGVLDRRLAPSVRRGLVAGLLVYGATLAAVRLVPPPGEAAAGATLRLEHHAFDTASPNARTNIWRSVGVLVQRHPWTGVGFGELNLAITLTPDPHRATAFLDHAHNLPLQLAAELGVPLAVAICVALAVALWRAVYQARRGPADGRPSAAGALAVVALSLLASQVEYPLWYAYFLLPTAFAWGLALGVPGPGPAPAASGQRRARLIGLLLVAGAAAAALDYTRVAAIYRPIRAGATIEQHVAPGLRSVFFSTMAGYATATINVDIDKRQAMGLAVHGLMDWRLMEALADWLARNGDVDRARFVAARLKEYNRAESQPYFAVCDQPGATAYQCRPPERDYDWREFQHLDR